MTQPSPLSVTTDYPNPGNNGKNVEVFRVHTQNGVEKYNATAQSGVDVGVEAGMSPDLQAHIAEPVGHGSAMSRRQDSGVGLGFSIARALIALHGGEIEIKSAEGKGTTVIITLPSYRLLAGKADA